MAMCSSSQPASTTMSCSAGLLTPPDAQALTVFCTLTGSNNEHMLLLRV